MKKKPLQNIASVESPIKSAGAAKRIIDPMPRMLRICTRFVFAGVPPQSGSGVQEYLTVTNRFINIV